MWSYILHNTLHFACVSSHHITQLITQEVQLVLPICAWVWCHSVGHGNPSSGHISKGELFFPKETTPCLQHFSKEWGWCFPTQSMLRFWFLCRIYASNRSCCEFTTVAPVSSRDVISQHSSTLYITSSSILSAFSSTTFSEPSLVKGGCLTGPLVKDFSSLDFCEAVSQAVIIPVLTEGGSAFQLTHDFIRGNATLSTLVCGPLRSRAPWPCLTLPEEEYEKIQKEWEQIGN